MENANKEKKVTVFSYRIETDKYEKLREISEKEKRSINSQLDILLDYALNDYEKLNPAHYPQEVE